MSPTLGDSLTRLGGRYYLSRIAFDKKNRNWFRIGIGFIFARPNVFRWVKFNYKQLVLISEMLIGLIDRFAIVYMGWIEPLVNITIEDWQTVVQDFLHGITLVLVLLILKVNGLLFDGRIDGTSKLWILIFVRFWHARACIISQCLE